MAAAVDLNDAPKKGRSSNRLLRKHHYPPDRQEKAIRLVLQQAEVIADDWVAA